VETLAVSCEGMTPVSVFTAHLFRIVPSVRRDELDQARGVVDRVTAYLKNGGTLEKAAQMANHASTRTTRLYDPQAEEVTFEEVERVVI
jgi:hypothetical protein